MSTIDKTPFFKELEESKNILIAGAGGGFDIFAGIPLYFNLTNQGKKITLANFSFTKLHKTTSEKVHPHCFNIRSRDIGHSGRNYFPEKYLKSWFQLHGENIELYAFEKTGVLPLRDAYKYLIKKHEIDTVILVDGGTDSLMFGDEDGLGTPEEDISSMAAVYRTGIKKQYLTCVGFGIDHFHGVSHFRFLENVAEIIKDQGYLGLFQIQKEMIEVQKYMDAIEFVNDKMNPFKSIVSNSIISAIRGNYGNAQFTERTKGSELWINPLMSIYWCFDLRSVIRKIKYYEMIKDTNTIGEFNHQLMEFRRSLTQMREKKDIPL